MERLIFGTTVRNLLQSWGLLIHMAFLGETSVNGRQVTMGKIGTGEAAVQLPKVKSRGSSGFSLCDRF